jgi:hypothetical protein
VFALGTVTNLAVGRVTFALGAAFALAAMLTTQRHVVWLAAGFAALSALASPVAAACLTLAVATYALVERAWRIQATAVIAAAIVPVVVVTWTFGSDGRYFFQVGDLALLMAMCLLFWFAMPADHRGLRGGVALYALVCLAVFVVPTPLGLNVSRYGQYLAAPLLACALWGRRRRALALVIVPLVAWQWIPAWDSIAHSPQDPSTRPGYYTALIQYLQQAGGPSGRLEIPFTYRHWESYYVAPQLLLARGWERQLDLTRDRLFYDGTLDANRYRTWLLNTRVRWVAVPDTALDPAGEAEAKLVRGGLSYLQPVWHDQHWQVWEVEDARPMVQGPATLTNFDTDEVSLRVSAHGPVDVGVHASTHWTVFPSGCAANDGTGWLLLRNLPIGPVTVTQSAFGTPCKA